MMDLEQVVDDLTVLDFFKFVPATHLEHARNSTLIALSEDRASLDFGLHWGDDRRIERPWRGDRFFHADAESLAECGVADCLWRLIPLLTRESGSVDPLADLQGWSAESGRTRKLSLLAAIEIIDTLLERSGSHERAYGAASGKDAGIYVLTPALFEYVRQLPLDRAYLPVSDADLRDAPG